MSFDTSTPVNEDLYIHSKNQNDSASSFRIPSSRPKMDAIRSYSSTPSPEPPAELGRRSPRPYASAPPAAEIEVVSSESDSCSSPSSSADSSVLREVEGEVVRISLDRSNRDNADQTIEFERAGLPIDRNRPPLSKRRKRSNGETRSASYIFVSALPS